jgi:hypothetical protein
MASHIARETIEAITFCTNPSVLDVFTGSFLSSLLMNLANVVIKFGIHKNLQRKNNEGITSVSRNG